jgi:predicted nuclease with RNAse H fold
MSKLEERQQNSWELAQAALRQLSPDFFKDEKRRVEAQPSAPVTAVESPLSITSRRINVLQYAQSLRKALIELDNACGLNPVQFQHEHNPSTKE